MKEFLKSYPLYSKFKLLENYEIGNEKYTNPLEFYDIRFEYFCEKEEDFKTFKIDLTSSEQWETYKADQEGNKIGDKYFIDEKLDYIFEAKGKCLSCGEFNVNFLFHVFSDKPISDVKNNISNISFNEHNTVFNEDTSIYIEKIGSYPEVKVYLEPYIRKYLDRNNQDLLYKGRLAIKNNLGIGAFAYFRRITENNLVNIIEEISKIPNTSSSEILKLLSKHKASPNISTIYDNIYEYLPESLKILGKNPLKLLYNITSQGLHSMSEKECLDKAGKIDTLLNFTFKKISEEKSEIKDIKDLIKDL